MKDDHVPLVEDDDFQLDRTTRENCEEASGAKLEQPTSCSKSTSTRHFMLRRSLCGLPACLQQYSTVGKGYSMEKGAPCLHVCRGPRLSNGTCMCRVPQRAAPPAAAVALDHLPTR